MKKTSPLKKRRISNQPRAPLLKKSPEHAPLPPELLRWQCDTRSLGISSSAEVTPSDDIIGQDRALRALKLGLDMHGSGYNIYVAGDSGTGRTTTVKHLLEQYKEKPAELKDHCLLYNFAEPNQPSAVSLPAGQGRALCEDMRNLLTDLLRDIPAMFESHRFQQARKSTLAVFQERQKLVMTNLERKVRDHGFEMVNIQVGNTVRPDVVPVIDGKPVSMNDVENAVHGGQLTPQQQEDIRRSFAELQDDMSVAFRELRTIDRKTRESLQELEERYLLPLIDEELSALRQKYSHPRLEEYFSGLRKDISKDFSKFQLREKSETDESDAFIEFQVNVLVGNSQSSTVPIIIETNPKYSNLFGSIDREQTANGTWYTDFMHVKCGSLLRADGGYLVLNALDTLLEPGVWYDLKRTLRTHQYTIHPIESLYGGIAGTTIKPEPFDLNVKVVFIGDMEIYYLLYFRDEDFKKIFKVRADFDYEMPKNKETIDNYINFVAMVAKNEHLLPFTADSLAQVIEFGVRLAGHKEKISTRFTTIADVIRESHYWAAQEHAREVQAKHVNKAIEEREFRLKLSEEKLQEMILQNSIMIATEGAVVGQVNGLSVYDVGEYAFGKPSRITAKISLGRSGVINIEREAELSGPTHNKGVAILSGFLSSRFAQNKPLVMNASIAFEQSYGGVDGDSASSTEVYAILSALSGIPLRQDIAVTGSVNQKGEIQPIGGVNIKIEGFYDVCKARGLSGTQGVIIPTQNIPDLMLREDVVAAVKERKFHVYAISHVDEGIEILTGMKAGVQNSNDIFEPGTINDRVDKRLNQYAKEWKKFEG
ncbi:MAG: AAA family ATPase [Bacteroidota bacterium]|nr:AAA family ATPase [Bacteroidota bacterium]